MYAVCSEIDMSSINWTVIISFLSVYKVEWGNHKFIKSVAYANRTLLVQSRHLFHVLPTRSLSNCLQEREHIASGSVMDVWW